MGPTEYCKKRMAERRVTMEDLLHALQHEVQAPRAGNRPGRIIRRGFAAGFTRIIEVVVNDEGQPMNVLIPKQ